MINWKCELEVLADKYSSYYNVLEERSRKFFLKKLLQEVEKICKKSKRNTKWLKRNSNLLYPKVRLDDFSEENKQEYFLLFIEKIFQRIREKDKDDNLLELFEYVFDINENNFINKITSFTKKISIDGICSSEIGFVIKLCTIKHSKISMKETDNELFWSIMLNKRLKIGNMNLTDKFMKEYISKYYKNVIEGQWIEPTNDISELYQYLDNPNIILYFMDYHFENFNEQQLTEFLDRISISNIIHIYYHNTAHAKRDEIVKSKLKGTYSSEEIENIIRILKKLLSANYTSLSFFKILENKAKAQKTMSRINKLINIFQEQDFNSDLLRLAIYYPDLIDSINETDNSNEKTISMLHKLEHCPILFDKPKSISELAEIMNKGIIATNERRRFQPDDSLLQGRFGAYKSIISIDKDGQTRSLYDKDHYCLVEVMYNAPKGKFDYFDFLVDISREQGYMTIISEGSSGFIYYPTVISQKQFDKYNSILDGFNINDLNAKFYLTQSLPENVVINGENYISYEEIDGKLLSRSDAVVILEERVEIINDDPIKPRKFIGIKNYDL